MLEELRERLTRDGSITISVRVLPRAARSELLDILADGSLRVKLAAVPEKGRANEELREVLAHYFGVSKSRVELISGQTSQHKRLKINR